MGSDFFPVLWQALDEDVSHFVNQLWDAVQTAYTKEDILLLQMFTDFLQQLRSYHSSGVLKRTITVRLLQQIFLVLDFSEGLSFKFHSLITSHFLTNHFDNSSTVCPLKIS